MRPFLLANRSPSNIQFAYISSFSTHLQQQTQKLSENSRFNNNQIQATLSNSPRVSPKPQFPQTTEFRSSESLPETPIQPSSDENVQNIISPEPSPLKLPLKVDSNKEQHSSSLFQSQQQEKPSQTMGQYPSNEQPQNTQPTIQNIVTVGQNKTSPRSPQNAQVDLTHDQRMIQFKTKIISSLLMKSPIDIQKVSVQTWTGCPPQFRAVIWKLLLGLLSIYPNRNAELLERKSLQYFTARRQYDKVLIDGEENSSEADSNLLHQIRIDLNRLHREYPLFQAQSLKDCLERVLYVWSIRHPSCGYVQGLHELVTPFLFVYLCDFFNLKGYSSRTDPLFSSWGLWENAPSIDELDKPLAQKHLSDPKVLLNIPPKDFEKLVTKDVLNFLETDLYWSLEGLLHPIQDNYTRDQPGIRKMVEKLDSLISRIDKQLNQHFTEINLKYSEFIWPWINCILMRQFQFPLVVRMFDTYFSTQPPRTGWPNFHVYVCAAILTRFAPQLKKKSFSDCMTFLLHLPTLSWKESQLAETLSIAFQLMVSFERSPSHLNPNNVLWTTKTPPSK